MIYVSVIFLMILVGALLGMLWGWVLALLDRRDPSRQFTAWRVAVVRKDGKKWMIDVETHSTSIAIVPFRWRWQANRAARVMNREHFKNGGGP